MGTTEMDILSGGVAAWNAWRQADPQRVVSLRKDDLRGRDLRGINLNEVNLKRCDLRGADLSGATFRRANLRRARLDDAVLQGVDLTSAILIDTSWRGATLTDAQVYGVSAWNVDLTGAVQRGLTITKQNAPQITVDNLMLAQFVYLLINQQGLGGMIDTMGKRSVLILGRFTPKARKDVLDGIRDKLRALNYIPIIFDFDRPVDRDYTETIGVLARLSLFVIADLSNPRSAPLELQSTVPDVKVPFVPIIAEDEPAFSMFKDLTMYPWMMGLIRYGDPQVLIDNLEALVVRPALERHKALSREKAAVLEGQSVEDLLRAAQAEG